jgi:hypothetical protein
MEWPLLASVVGSKSVFGEFPTRAQSKPLKIRFAALAGNLHWLRRGRLLVNASSGQCGGNHLSSA